MKNIFLVVSIIIGSLLCSCTSDTINNTDNKQNIINITPIKTSLVKCYSNSINIDNTTLTRAADVNSNMWTDMPAYPSVEEKTGVMEYIMSNPTGVAWPGYKTFYIQHVDGAHHTYSYTDYNGAEHQMDGTQSMEQLSILEDRELYSWETIAYQHVNNFNAGKCDNPASHNATRMLDGFKAAYTLNEYSNDLLEAWKIFYWKGNYYLGLDYYCVKQDAKTQPAINPDGCYDDWVVKIIPSGEEAKVPEGNTDNTTVDDLLKGEVETNLSMNAERENDDYIFTKTSVHIKDTTDFTMIIPVPADYYCPADDMYIIEKHEESLYTYNSTTEIVERTINGQKVNLYITYNLNNITIKSSGINKDVLKYCRNEYGDGITFEIYNYYNSTLNRTQLQEYLNNSTIKFTNSISSYKNAKLIDLDCTVTN